LQVSLARTFCSLRNVLQDLLFEYKIGEQFLELTVLKIQLLELAALIDVQTTAFIPVSVVAPGGQPNFFFGIGFLLSRLSYLDSLGSENSGQVSHVDAVCRAGLCRTSSKLSQ
jgi:hypothetical protein